MAVFVLPNPHIVGLGSANQRYKHHAWFPLQQILMCTMHLKPRALSFRVSPLSSWSSDRSTKQPSNDVIHQPVKRHTPKTTPSRVSLLHSINQSCANVDSNICQWCVRLKFSTYYVLRGNPYCMQNLEAAKTWQLESIAVFNMHIQQ